MIYFFADNHFDKHPGLETYKRLVDKDRVVFHEDDFTQMEEADFSDNCSLLILNMIGCTSGQEHASSAAEKQIKKYMEMGKDLLLLHGSSAAFWKWDWWRTCTGLRWVRGEDPDGVATSTHPRRPFKVTPSKTRHPLISKLPELDIPHEEEIYINLEQTNPITILMETNTEEGTFAQCYESVTPWGGRVLCFLPGHEPETFDIPQYMQIVNTLLEELTPEK